MATRIAMMPVPELVEFVNEWGTLPRALDKRPPSHRRPSTELADELHPIFAAGTDRERATLVTALLRRAKVRPTLAEQRGVLVEEWTVDDASQAQRAAAALALRHQLAEHPGRIGICADDQCADVWVDASPAGKRRFCCLTCQNRARAAAFRKKRSA
jgi:predicted RNA-binding Zn ribbon-like protein